MNSVLPVIDNGRIKNRDDGVSTRCEHPIRVAGYIGIRNRNARNSRRLDSIAGTARCAIADSLRVIDRRASADATAVNDDSAAVVVLNNAIRNVHEGSVARNKIDPNAAEAENRAVLDVDQRGAKGFNSVDTRTIGFAPVAEQAI